MKSSHRCTVIHGVERGNLIDTHRRHLQQPGNLIHDTDACEAVLALAKVEKRHHGGFLILWGVALEDFGDELLTDGIEFKGNLRVIVWGISMLRKTSAPGSERQRRKGGTYDLQGFTSHAGRSCEKSALRSFCGF